MNIKVGGIRKMKGKIKFALLISVLVILASGFVVAQPLGAETVTPGTSERFNDTTTPSSVEAQAGNVTELSISGIAVTKSWQGFYGNITGTIILADAAGNNFYDWNVSTPTGQVYASRNDSIDWTGVNCALEADIIAEQTALGHTSDSPDSVNNTFTATNHPAFTVGAITPTLCPTTQAYDNTTAQGGAFYQILLSDSSNMIYTTLIEDTQTLGFNNNPWHFQLLVGENGYGNEDTTTYYFYLELQ